MFFSILGPIQARTARDEPLALKGRNQRRLLGALVAQAPRVASSAHLIDVLWGDRLPADPAGALQTEVSRLRSALRRGGGDEVVISEPHGYRLSVPADRVDAYRFEALLNSASTAPTAEVALARLDEALALWRGEPYAEFAEDREFLGESNRLRELRAGARERRVELLLTLGRIADAVAAVEPLVRESPHRERPTALRMEALYRAGRQSEAIAAFQEYRRRLSEELGLEPSPALRHLEVEIIRHARVLAPRDQTPAPGAPPLRVAFLHASPARLAYGEAGEGVPLLMLPAWVSNLAAIGAGSDPRAGFLGRMAERCRLILYDRVGMGLSSGSAVEPSLDSDVSEALRVLDAIGVVQAALLGISQGGPVAVALAARHPERVSRLVLIGTYASGPLAFPKADVRASVLALIRAHWGLGSRVLADLILPGATAEDVERFARVQRESATPEAAARALEALYAMDVSGLLPVVSQPTLVMHYTEDVAIPFRAGQALAAALPHAQLVPLPGMSHLPSDADVERVAALVGEFIGHGPAPKGRH